MSDTPDFVYLLNAMDHAASKTCPADHDYYGKRQAVLDHVAQLERELNEARAQLAEKEELHRMQLAGISVAALQNTRESAAYRHILRENPYWTVAYADVCAAVDREMTERERAETAEAQLADLKAALGTVMEKLYPHDCEECIYLGSATAGGRAIDMYYHAKPETFVARYGYEGPEYTSGDTFAYGMDAGVTLARLLAVQAGLTKVTPAADALRLLEGKC